MPFLLLLPALLLLAGCGGTSHRLPFAALAPDTLSEGPAPRNQTQPKGAVMPMAGGAVQLAAPENYCFDKASSKADAHGGFALMAQCNRGRGLRRFGARNTAVLTASIGPAKQQADAPQTTDIVAMFPRAKVLETRNDQLLPLVLLEAPQAVAAGASPVHWRGAFVLDEQLVALALYAPDGSRALGPQGAALMNETTHRTLEASSLPPVRQTKAQPAPAAVQLASPRLRPRPRPPAMAAVAAVAADAAPARRSKKRGLGRRISSLFNNNHQLD